MSELLTSEALAEFLFKHGPYEFLFIVMCLFGYHYVLGKTNKNGCKSIEKELKCLKRKVDDMDKKYIEKVAILETKIDLNGRKR